MLSQCSQPIPEEGYIRVVYIGKLRLVTKSGKNLKDKPTLKDIIDDIQKEASEFNRRNFISGHLYCCKTLHIAQLLEGKETVVLSLMERIRSDPRVVIYKEFIKKTLLHMHVGWALSMYYSFEITPAQLQLVENT